MDLGGGSAHQGVLAHNCLCILQRFFHQHAVGSSGRARQMLAASVLGLVGLIGSAGGILGGLLSDRIGREKAYTLGSAAVLAGIFLLLGIRDNTSPRILYAFVILYGLGYGSILPVTAGTTGDLFPGNSLGRILAIQSIGFGLGGALGPYLGGYFHDLTGNYVVPLLISIISILAGIYSIWMAAPRRTRR